MMRRSTPLVLALLLAGCNLAPPYVRPAPAVPDEWPAGAAYPPAARRAPGITWETLVTDGRLRSLIRRALADNRSLQATVANVAAARAQIRIQRANQFPAIAGNAGASVTRGVTNRAGEASNFDANVGMSSFEIDLFGRQRNLTKEAFEQYLASQSGLAATRITLIGSVATEYATLAADRDLLAIAQDTLASAQQSFAITRSLQSAGLAAMIDVANAQTTVAQAKADIEQDTTNIAQDRNALQLLVGSAIDDSLLPTGLADLDRGLTVIPAGLSSAVLLDRPDVVEAEHQLKGADAAIGAARAAFFPTISLTSAIGVASQALSSLFTGGALSWSASGQGSVPILGGGYRGRLAYARAQRDYDVAEYQYTVQTAFREVADGLARRGTIDRQHKDQADLVAAASQSYTLSMTEYHAGVDSFIDALIAQRTLYGARQTQVTVKLLDLENRVALYQYTGGAAGV